MQALIAIEVVRREKEVARRCIQVCEHELSELFEYKAVPILWPRARAPQRVQCAMEHGARRALLEVVVLQMATAQTWHD